MTKTNNTATKTPAPICVLCGSHKAEMTLKTLPREYYSCVTGAACRARQAKKA